MVILLGQLKGLRLDRFVVAREDIARDGTTVNRGFKLSSLVDKRLTPRLIRSF